MPAYGSFESPRQVFDKLNTKYPGKHWAVISYNNVGGWHKHAYYVPRTSTLCESGNSNIGRYHGVHNGKQWHVLWKNAATPNAWGTCTIGSPCPHTQFPASCQGCCTFGWKGWLTPYDSCTGGAYDIFQKAEKKEIVVELGNGLTGWGNFAANGFGFANVHIRHFGHTAKAAGTRSFGVGIDVRPCRVTACRARR